MKKIILTFTILFIFSFVSGQTNKELNCELKGELSLTVDISKMKDTVGKFMVMIAGVRYFPEVKNNSFNVTMTLKEPREIFINFYSEKLIKKNKGKQLYEFAPEYSDFTIVLGMPGKMKVVVLETVSKSKIINPTIHHKKHKILYDLKESYPLYIIKKMGYSVKSMDTMTNKILKDSIINHYRQLVVKEYPKFYNDSVLGFIRNNPNEPASLLELFEYSMDSDKELSILANLYSSLNKKLQELPFGDKIKSSLDAENFAKNNLLNKDALNFELTDEKGNLVSLNSFKGKVVLLEFWASWCGPCRALNPDLKKAYEKYKDKGFIILSISLDEKKEKWLEAIKEDDLKWTHLSDLKGFNSNVAHLYHINYIPINFLIDRDGKIVATKLEGKELNEWLQKILK